MPQHFILIIMGIAFTVFGLGFLLWGISEEKAYYRSISTRFDVREFLNHQPLRPEPGALKIGGWIALTLGILILGSGIGLWLWG